MSVPSQVLQALRKLESYRSLRQHIFPSRGSLDWYLRTHREGLVKAGALVRIGGAWFCHEQKFDAYVLKAAMVAAEPKRAPAEA